VIRCEINATEFRIRNTLLRASDKLLVESGGTQRFEVDDGDSASQTSMLVRQDGVKRRVKTVFVPADTWGAGLPSSGINVLYVD
jgi:hypothetical protein